MCDIVKLCFCISLNNFSDTHLYDFVQIRVHLTLLLGLKERQREFWDFRGLAFIQYQRGSWNITHVIQLNTTNKIFINRKPQLQQ